jgi:hypothetical protein
MATIATPASRSQSQRLAICDGNSRSQSAEDGVVVVTALAINVGG